MKSTGIVGALLVLVLCSPGAAQVDPPRDGAPASFSDASLTVTRQLEESLAELSRRREEITGEKIPLSRKLSELESELLRLRGDFQRASRLLDSRRQELANLQSEIKRFEDESTYVSDRFVEYTRGFETRLHIAERHRYDAALKAAQLAPENERLSKGESLRDPMALMTASLDRLSEALGGARFEGTAVGPDRLVKEGQFLLVGPAALFRSADGTVVGLTEQRLGSFEPTVLPFPSEEDAASAALVVSGAGGRFVFDPTLGNAHKMEETQETLVEHVLAGGPVMYPILALAAAALLVALGKWVGMLFVRRPSRKSVAVLFDAVARGERESARRAAEAIKGPAGKMLSVGADHLAEPRELIEEVMYETVLATRLRLQRFLPFIAITASSAPLLGLLGTVTGIMNTFKLMTVFQTGDIKSISSGISEALITTEWGLYVAIPSLLFYAFLSRKARSVIDSMEEVAVSFLNHVSRVKSAEAAVVGESDGAVALSATAPLPTATAALAGGQPRWNG